MQTYNNKTNVKLFVQSCGSGFQKIRRSENKNFKYVQMQNRFLYMKLF